MHMKLNFKRLMAMFLSIMMIVGMMPTAVFAMSLDDLQDAIDSGEGEITLDGDIIDDASHPVVVDFEAGGSQSYATLAEAFAATTDGDEVEIRVAGKYSLTGISGKNITVTGTVDGVEFTNIGAFNMGSASVTFNNVTFTYAETSTYKGLQHSGDLVYNDCTFNGQVFLYGTSETFNNCEFYTADSNNYNVWTYGAQAVEFNGCTFYSAGKSVLVYNEGACATELDVIDTNFIAYEEVEGKAAIEIDTSKMPSGTKITVDAATTAAGFATGSVSGNSLWNDKKADNSQPNGGTTSVVVVDGETVKDSKDNVTYVAQVGDDKYTDLQDAIVAAAPAGTVDILADVTVDEWIMFSQRLTIGSGQIITLDMNGLTINGNNHTLSVNSIESATNGDRLFHEADNLTIKNLTINNNSNEDGGISLKSGELNNVTFNGGVGVFPGTGEITITGCDFNTAGSAIYNETDRDNLVVTGNTFNTAAGQYAIYLRGNTTFTDNTVVSGKVNVVNGSPVVTGNNFGEERFKVYNGATATISGNTINNLVFNDENVPQSNFTENILSTEAQAALDAVTAPAATQVKVSNLAELQAALADTSNNLPIVLTQPIVISAGETVVLDLNGKSVTYNSTVQGEAMITNKGTLTINDSSDPDTGVINYNYTGAADSTYGKGNYTISNGGTLTVNGGKITIANLRAHAKYPIDNNSTSGDAILVINGGHLYNYNTSAIRQFCNSTTNQNSVTINGGLIEGYCAIWVQNPGKNTVNGTLSITGGEIKTTAAAYVNGTSDLKDVASCIYCTIDGEGGEWDATSAVSITGGTINENVSLAEEAPAEITIGEGAIFNGYVETPAPAAPTGSNSFAYTKEVDGYVRVWGEGGGNAKESFVLKLYSDDTLIATTELNNVGGIIDGDVYVTWNFFYPESNDEYWTTTWEEGHPNADAQPTKVELYIDGTLVATTDAQMNGADGINPVVWADLGGVASVLPEVIEIFTWEDLKALDTRVEGGDMLEGVTVKLMNDIDLYEMGEGGEPVTFNPIGANTAYFKGTFDGQGHTIKNMYQSGWALGYDWYNYGTIGLFAYLWDATVKNLTIENAECFVEGGNVAGIAGCAWGNCTFENITIKNSTYATYNNRAAGIVGYTGGEGTMTFKNVMVDEDTVIAALWGSYDCTLGGVVGSTQSPTMFHFEDVTVECKLDCYNDVTASYKWYSYRMCGMLIGRMETLQTDAPTEVDPRGVVTIDNVNITIGEWANQTYIWDDSLSKGCQRVEPGYAYDGINVENYPDAEITELGFNTIIGGPQSQSSGYYGSDITKLEALEGFEDQAAELEVEDIALEIRSRVAQVGDEYFTSLQTAIDEANGNTITLIADTAEEIAIANGATVVINLGGKTLTGCFKPFEGNLTVSNGTIDNNNSDYSAIEINAGTLNITNVDVTSTRHGVRIDGAVTATINGGTYKSDSTSGTRHAVNVSGAANVTIKGGTFVGPKGTTMDSGSAVCVQSGAAVTIEGGNFSGGKNATLGVSGTMSVTGGTFDQDPSAYVASGYKAELTESVYTVIEDVTDVAKIGDTTYTSLQDAINAAQDGDEIIVISDINLADNEINTLGGKYKTYFLVEGKTITVNLNGKKIYGEYTGDSMLVGVFSTDNNGHLTLTGNGIVDVTATTTVYGLLVNYEDGCSITVEDGTYTLDKASDSLIYTGGNEGVIINGGTFTLGNVGTGSNGSPWIFNAQGQGENHVLVYGGTFNANIFDQYWRHEVQCDGESTITDNGNGTWTVARDAAAYVIEQEGAYGYEVGYKTIDDAIEAAQDGETVTILAGEHAVPTMKEGITVVGETKADGTPAVLLNGTLSGTLENLTLKNLHIKGGNAQRWAYAKGDCTFENVTFEATSVYALHFDGITEGANLLYKDCTIIGWVAMGGSPASCVFDGCTIKDNGTYGVIRTYFNTTIQNCTFDVDGANTSDVYQDGIHSVGETTVVTVTNCTNSNGSMVDLINVSGTSVVMLDGKKIQNVAKVGDNYYMSLPEAIAAAEENGTVQLISDIALSETLKVTSNVTLDLNGKTISGTDNATGSFGLIEIQPGADLTINDTSAEKTGKITLTATSDRDWNAYSSVISNQRGKLTVNGGTIEHLGGTDMAYGIDNLTNGKGTYAETVINGGTVKSTYRAIRQFLNGVEAQNILTVNGGTIEGTNKSIWFQDPNANANSGTLTVDENATLKGDVYLYVTPGSTEWPVAVSIKAAALDGESTVMTGNIPAGYVVEESNGTWGVREANYVAKIGENYYEKLSDAIAKATAGDTIELIADVTENVTITKSLTIDGAKFDYTGNISIEGSTVSVTVKDVNFVNGTGYAITTNRIKSITVEDCTVTNYAYGFLYANKSTPTVVVKNVTVDGGNYGFHWVYGTSATLENVTMTNVTYGLYIQNYAAKTITLKDCNITSINIWERSGSSGVQTFKFEGENTVDTLTNSQYAKYVLGAADATLTAPAGFDVTTTVANSMVKYVEDTYKVVPAVAKIGEDKLFETFVDALNAVQDGETITVLDAEGSEISTKIEFTKDIDFTITGTAPNYALPVVTFQNATVNIKKAEILIPELDARQNATINVIDSIVHDAGGNSIVKSYYNGAINISGTSVVYAMQVTTMGYITVSDTAKLTATWQTNVYGNGLITVKDDAQFNTAALHLTGKDYSGRDNTDDDRVGKPAQITVDGATFIVGKALSDGGADYSYNSSKGINIGTITGKKAVLDIKNGAKVNIYMANGETANIGADGTVNVDDELTVACRNEDGTATLVNNGSIVLTTVDSVVTANDCGNVTTDVDGYEVKYADGKYVLVEKAAISVFRRFTTIVMGNDLALNFYMTSNSTFEEGENYYAVVTKKYADGRKDVVTIVEKANWGYNGTYYVTADSIAAKEMGDNITVQIFKGEVGSGVPVSETWTDSVLDYATRLLANSKNEKEKKYAVDMLNYGAAAQTHFKYNTNNLVNSGLTEEQKALASAEVTKTDNRFNMVTSYKFTTASFESNIVLNFYYATKITSANVTYDDHYGESHTYTVTAENGGIVYDATNSAYKVVIDTLVVGDVDTLVTCEVFDGNTNLGTTVDSIGSYLARAIAGSTGTEKALYVEAAKFTSTAHAYLHN